MGVPIKAGSVLTDDVTSKYLAPTYQYASNGTSTSVATSGSFVDYTGQLSVTIDVTDTGVLLVGWGFEGYNNKSNASSLRVGIAMSGANSASPSLDINACVSCTGITNTGAFASSRWHVYTGLSSGSTTLKLQGRLSSGDSTNNFLDNQWLYVATFY